MLEVRNLSFAYPGGPSLFHDLNVEVQGGQVLAVVGRNGAGKSTFLKMLNGILRPLSGNIFINGLSTENLKINEIGRHVGTLFQTPEQQLFAPTVYDEVSFGPRQFKLDPAEVEHRTEQALRRCGLEHAQSRHPLDLETASRRFLTLASILANSPSILLLDEPQRGLDRVCLERLIGIIDDERSKGHLIILVCHDMNFVWENADAVLAIGCSNPVDVCSVQHFFARPDLVQSSSVDFPAITIVQHMTEAQSLTCKSVSDGT